MKLAAQLAFWLFAVASSAPTLAQDDPPAPFSDPAWEPTAATAEVLAECSASIDAAIEARDVVALREALRRANGYDAPELVGAFERVVCLPAWPSATEEGQAHVDAQHPSKFDDGTGAELSELEFAQRVSEWEAWRPHGLVAATIRAASDGPSLAVLNLAMRHDDLAFEALGRCLTHPEVAANPVTHSRVIAALAGFERSDAELESRMCALLLSVDEIAPELLLRTMLPPYAALADENVHVHALPADAVASRLSRARARSREALMALADGLMLGSDRFTASVKATRELTATDPVVAVSSQIGALCANALESHFREPFAWSDRKSHDRARELVEPLAAGVLHPPVPWTPSAARAALERAVESRDGDKIGEALKGAIALDPPKLIPLLEDVAALPVLPRAKEQAVMIVDAEVRKALDEIARLTFDTGHRLDPTTRARFELQVMEWRPIGLEIAEFWISALHVRRICEYLNERADGDAFDSLVRILRLPAVRVNPFSRSEVIRALARSERSSKTIDDELCRLIASAERIDQEIMRLVPMPRRGGSSSAMPMGVGPILEAVRYYERRGTKRRKVVSALIDGLMFGHDPKDKEPAKVNGSPIVLRHEDPAVEVARSIGRACSLALFACTGKAYPTLSREAQNAAKEWLKLEGKDAGFE